MRRLIAIAGSVGVVHGLEDVALLSMGRFLPVPIWAMYAIGLTASMVLMTLLVNRLVTTSRNQSEKTRQSRKESAFETNVKFETDVKLEFDRDVKFETDVKVDRDVKFDRE